MEKKETGSFEVKDKRRFVADSAGEAQGEEEAPKAEERQQAAPPPREAEPAAKAKTKPLPEIDFATFILSYVQSALLHLGLVENPATKKTERNLPLAKQAVDIIVMLRDKTKGNLSPDESNFVENIIADLRLKYVNEVNR